MGGRPALGATLEGVVFRDLWRAITPDPFLPVPFWLLLGAMATGCGHAVCLDDSSARRM